MKNLIKRTISTVLALILAASSPIYAEGDELSRYIIIASGDMATLEAALIENEIDILCRYERVFDGFAVKAGSREALLALPGVGKIVLPSAYLTLGDDVGSSVTEDELAFDAQGASRAISHLEGYSGEGVVVAVIDDGFNLDGDIFTLSADAEISLDKARVEACADDLTALALAPDIERDELYYSKKLPFVFDYAGGDAVVSPEGGLSSHGTAVASLIGAGGERTGAAPDAQLLLMKVSDGYKIGEIELVSALEDALILGADIVNLSLGASYFGGDSVNGGAALDLALASCEGEGVTVVRAVGNSGTSYSEHFYDEYGIDLPLANMPDSGTAAGFELDLASLAVGSADYYFRRVRALESTGGAKFIYSDSSGEYTPEGELFADVLDGMTLPLVPVPGLGTPEDFASVEVAGKLALVMRGELPFADKVKNAAEAGAVGVIVYNNEKDAELVTMALEGATIPAVFVTNEVGEALIAEGECEIVISSRTSMLYEVEGGGGVSTFSSRGYDNSRGALPTLVAFGGNINAPASESVYETLDGTSYSAALISGYSAVLLEFLREVGGDTSPGKIKLALANSAVPIKEDGVLVSPRAQGAGLVSLEAASNLTVIADSASVALGSIRPEEGAELSFTLENLTASPLSLAITGEVITDSALTYEYGESDILIPVDKSEAGKFPYFIPGSAPLPEAKLTLDGLNINKSAEGAETATLTLAPGESRSITIKLDGIALPEAFENGGFVEGMIYIKPDVGSEISLPFCGFAGDYEALPIADASIYDEGFASEGGSRLSSYAVGMYYNGEVILGENSFDSALFDLNKASFSPDGNGNMEFVKLTLPLLRDADSLRFVISSAAGGEIYRSEVYNKLKRSFTAGNVELMLWDGRDPENAVYVYPDGEYRADIYLTPAGGGDEQCISFTFIVDTEAPTVENVGLEGDRLTFEAKDNLGVQYVCVYTMDYEGLWRDFIEYKTPIDGDYYEFDISSAEGDYIYIEVEDYGGNYTTERIGLEAAE